MTGGKEILTFPRPAEFAKAKACLDRLSLTHTIVSPFPFYGRVGVDSLAMELVDAWHTLEKIRCRVNDTWGRRHSIAPCWEMRKKPPALEIYKRLPGTNCRACGEKTCLAFSVRLWSGEVKPSLCTPIFTGAYGHLRAPFLEICSSLGLVEMAFTEKDE